jgi:hypothetical protein
MRRLKNENTGRLRTPSPHHCCACTGPQKAYYEVDGYQSLELAERNFTNTMLSVVPALPALIRMARAAEQLQFESRYSINSNALEDVWEALQELRNTRGGIAGAATGVRTK